MLMRIILVSLILFLAGCGTTQSVSGLKQSDLSKIRSVSILKLPDNSDKIGGPIANHLRGFGIRVDSEALEPGDTTTSDALISYSPVWAWDLVTYLYMLQINIIDSSSGKIISRANWTEAPFHSFRNPGRVATTLLDQMIPKSAVGAQIDTSTIVGRRVQSPKLAVVLSQFDDDLARWRECHKAGSYTACKNPINGSGDAGIASARPESVMQRTSPGSSDTPDIDRAIAQAKIARSSAPRQIDGCNTGIDHLRDRLPICRENEALMKMRELWLLSDASFKENIAAGATLAQIATEQARLAREFESSLVDAEAAMQSAAADGQLASRRITALKQIPSRCDAGPQDQFGMQEQAYQAYVNAYMAAQANRALSAIAACRARAGK